MAPTISDAIESLKSHHDIATFSCGKPSLNSWLRARALRNQETGNSRTFVLADSDVVIGFYALTTASIARVGLPGAYRRNAPAPVPVLLLGQLAVDTRYAGKGFGRRLLADALLRVADASPHIGFRALATHPLDDDAEKFYLHYGFAPIPDSRPPLMLLPRQRLLAAVAAFRR